MPPKQQLELPTMMPKTKHGLPALICRSALQKCIRRGLEREAMELAVELIHTSPAYCTMVCNVLETISHEDIDTGADPTIVPFVHTAMQQAREWYKHKTENPGGARLAVGNAIRLMCRAKKSREGDHFQAAIGLANLLEDHAPLIPDFALDMHTAEGKARGRGLEHWREEGTLLVPTPEKDAYEEEAYRLWVLKAQRNGRR